MLALRSFPRRAPTAAIPSIRLVPASRPTRMLSAMAQPQPESPPAKEAPTARPLYSRQAELPHLPVPALDKTLSKYLQTVKPYLNDQELAKTSRTVEAFAQSEEGRTLQQRLVDRARQPGMVNWLADWWDDLAYLRVRDPVVINVSYFYAFEDDRLRRSSAQRAADLTYAALQFRQSVVEETIQPETIRGQPLCMASYKNMFHTCRIPAQDVDHLQHYDSQAHQHIAVVRQNHFYTVPTHRPDGTPLTVAEWECQFDRILRAETSPGPALGALSAGERNTWAADRESLLAAHPGNRDHLEQLESAAFLVCLDSTTPVTRDEHARMCWHGDGRNRFYDKPLQFLVADNGRAGFLGEHAGMDGTATSRLSNYILSHARANYQTPNQSGDTSAAELPAPARLNFQLNDTVHRAVQRAEAQFDQLIDRHQLRVLAYQGYGKNLIKMFRASPDSYVQMLMQLAYYKMYGRCDGTYESVQTRKFARGRTEVCRSVSVESVAFVRAMDDPTITDPVTKWKLAQEAIRAHSQYMKEAAEGQGIDRHLLGLKLCLRPHEPVPAMFQDPVFSKSNHWNLSTSQLSSPYYAGWGYGEVVPDGYGLAYMIKDDSLHFNVTCANEPGMDATRLHHYLEEAANDMRDVFKASIDGASNVLKAKL
ncbi:Carnitine O-acetyltransferase mitochondrial [Tieghemiomyces parasiticus]|uniref:Carnitine O-acetyltransferase, mitochondrial n=1 Tax=Tieghemiomyces parasiticus TaxID=78921 RepID=A0A9W8ABA0_9FUNG|nr:Carnitine O-acetyltransferase mitochondrial [Tieghemiomyces parasiticus]